MSHGKKMYQGGLKTELDAAHLYDDLAIQANGAKVSLIILTFAGKN